MSLSPKLPLLALSQAGSVQRSWAKAEEDGFSLWSLVPSGSCTAGERGPDFPSAEAWGGPRSQANDKLQSFVLFRDFGVAQPVLLCFAHFCLLHPALNSQSGTWAPLLLILPASPTH